ncbi:GAF domain-containing protein [Streptacidiphilus fuscans]|uniref:GAF domain-containing protein n=1 Tax=Streptacidiphilus fuscans TaxID=2789292 RepID=A0A931AX56_9ACTN|nr:GAF domain-containing protein [Streptacidiphilus fuscans]MBF9067019.1 GAF domain-containing protein [Streptacidiphilus fuscans]
MSRSQSLVEPLQDVTAPYRTRAARTPASPPLVFGSGVDELPALVSLSREQPVVARTLSDAVTALHQAPHLASALPHLLEDAMDLMGADFANVQIVDPRDGSLVLVAQSGFGPAFLEHFAVVRDDDSVCGLAARQRTQAVVADVRAEPTLEPHWGVFRAAGVRAVQSTPLLDGTGRLIGMISTHTPSPRGPSTRSLQVMDLYSRFAGEAVAQFLDGTSPLGRAADRGRG